MEPAAAPDSTGMGAASWKEPQGWWGMMGSFCHLTPPISLLSKPARSFFCDERDTVVEDARGAHSSLIFKEIKLISCYLFVFMTPPKWLKTFNSLAVT